MANSTVNISTGESHRLVDEARVEVDVGVQLAVDEVRVGQRGLLERQRDVEQRVLAGHLEHVVRGLLDDRRPRVVVLVHPVAEAHQAALAGLHRLDERRHVVDRPDLGASARRPRWRRRAAGRTARCAPAAARVRVGLAGADDAHRRGAAVLLVVGVQDEQHVHRPLEHRVDLVVADLPHHVEEVRRVRQVVVGVVERQAHREPVGDIGASVGILAIRRRICLSRTPGSWMSLAPS
jgi:hypothetical protein